MLESRLPGAAPANDDEGLLSWFLISEAGLSNLLVSGVKLRRSLDCLFTLVNPALTGLKPPEFTAVKPEAAGFGSGAASAIGVSRSFSDLIPFSEDCRASEAWRAGESPLRLSGVLAVDLFIGVFAGLGVKGPPYSASNCW